MSAPVADTAAELGVLYIAHQGLRALLYDIGTTLQVADFLDAPASDAAIERLCDGCALLLGYGGREGAAYLDLLRTPVAELVECIEAENTRLDDMIEALLQHAREVARSDGALRETCGRRLNRAYDELVAAYLAHLLREESEVWPAVREHCSPAQILRARLKCLATINHPRARGYRAWVLGSLSNRDLAALLRDANHTAAPAIYATLTTGVREVLGAARYAAVVRLAGLGRQLDLPYTPTAAEMVGEEEEQNVLEVLRRRRLWRYEVSSRDSFVARFEEHAEELLGVRHVHATVSGTVALQVAMMALGLGPGDEIIIPAVTWVGCADAAILCGAVPVLAQIDETLGVDPADVQRCISPHTKAIMGVSLYGNPCNIAALREIADRHAIALLEDDCQCAGVSYRGRRLGGYGDVAAFSTNFMKFIAAGDGGFVATNRDDVYEFAVMFTGGKSFPDRKREMNLSTPAIPFSTLRMNELTGAVVLAQLQRLDWLLARLRSARDAILLETGDAKSFTRILGNDPEGDAGWMIPLRFGSAPACQAFAAAVRAQGIQHVSTWKESFAGAEIHHCFAIAAGEQFIPRAGAHCGADFRAMIERRSVDPRSNPWTHPLCERDVSYPEGFVDDSLALVKQIAMIQTNPRLEPEHCAVIGAAIRAADEEVASGFGSLGM